MSEFLRTGHYINGEWYESANTYPVFNPATGDVIAQVAKGGADETSKLSPPPRARCPAGAR